MQHLPLRKLCRDGLQTSAALLSPLQRAPRTNDYKSQFYTPPSVVLYYIPTSSSHVGL